MRFSLPLFLLSLSLAISLDSSCIYLSGHYDTLYANRNTNMHEEQQFAFITLEGGGGDGIGLLCDSL